MRWKQASRDRNNWAADRQVTVGANELVLRRLGGLEGQSVVAWIQGLSQVVTAPPSKRPVRGAAGCTAVETHCAFHAWNWRWCHATGVTEAERR